MRYDIKYMDSSLGDMASIKKYLSQFYSSTWTKAHTDIKRHISFLEKNPHGFPFYQDSGIYRKLVAGNYIVLYKINDEENKVEVHAVWHGSMNIEQHIKNLPE